MADAIVAKLCTVCGIDCSGKPRIKDQQGRYICKECFDKAKQTRQTQKNPAPAAVAATDGASEAAAEGDNSFLLGLGSTKASTGLQGTKPCPECGRAMGTEAVVCIGCGYNTGTGKRHVVKVVKTKQKVEKERSGGGAASGFFQNGPLLGLIIFLIHAGSGAALFIEPSIGLAMLGLSLLVALVVWIATIVAALRENSVWGLICIIPLMAAIWGLFMTEDTRFRSIWGGHILGSIARAVIATFIVAGSGN